MDDWRKWDLDGCRLLIEYLFKSIADEYVFWLSMENRTLNKKYKEKCRAEMKDCEQFYLSSPLVKTIGADPVGVIDTLRRNAGYPISYTEELRRKKE